MSVTAEHGSRQNPIHVTGPGHMAQAARRHADPPTEAEAHAGNYQMGHVIVGGLEISIETPMGHMREGVAPDGTAWAVRMPADYGYVKNTEGADGDHVDVYIGPRAHLANEHPVWVVDQIDADTRDFDEHKVLLGFPHTAAAKHAYEGGFSDGRGRERIGAVTRMKWEKFMEWLARGECSEPIAYSKKQKSASAKSHYSGSVPSCSCGCGGEAQPTRGDYMSKQTLGDTAASVREVGFVSRLVAKAFGGMTPAERTEFVADAAAVTSLELGKAKDLLSMDEGNKIGLVDDLWDGPPDQRPELQRTGGPGAHVPAGKVPTGPRQEASGDGAIMMERHYSHHAPQEGVADATSWLGREIAKAKRATFSLFKGLESVDTRLTALESTALTPTTSEIGTIVAKAIAAATPALLMQAGLIVAKAMAEGDGESEGEDEPEDKACAKAEHEEHSEEEVREEAEEENDKHKEAAKCRLIAKALTRLAVRALAKAEEAKEDKDEKEHEAHAKCAKARLAKARVYFAVAKAISGADTGPRTAALAKSIKAAAKELNAQSVNQTKWATHNVSEVGKATPAAVTGDQHAMLEAFKAANAKIEGALSGVNALQTNMQGMFDVLMRQPAGDALPPVFTLAKAKPGDFDTIDSKITNLEATNIISLDDGDRARDVLGRAKRGMPVDGMVNVLPAAVQEVIRAQIAA